MLYLINFKKLKNFLMKKDCLLAKILKIYNKALTFLEKKILFYIKKDKMIYLII